MRGWLKMFNLFRKSQPATQVQPAAVTLESVLATAPANYSPPEWDAAPACILSDSPRTAQPSPQDGQRLLDTLQELAGIQATLHAARRGAIVSVYDIELQGRARLAQVAALAPDIAVRMAGASATVTAVPGAPHVRIEIAGGQREIITPQRLFTELETAPGVLPVVLGETVDGQPRIADLQAMPHLLVAGTTGSGKSVLLHCLLLSLIMRQTPEQCRLVLIDPKMLEFVDYDQSAHRYKPVITDASEALEVLQELAAEMDARYRLMSLYGARDLTAYNAVCPPSDVLPRIVVCIDEYADLIGSAASRKALEAVIQRLAQKARAAGIHLILATQRPSADVITSVIKANFPTRIAMKVPSAHDSRVIMGRAGAETLAGHGDMYFGDERLHCPFVTAEDVQIVTGWN